MTDEELFGRIAVKEGFITLDQLNQVASLAKGRPLGRALVERGILSESQVQDILHIRRIHILEESGGALPRKADSWRIGPYEILETLGRGAGSVVYKARRPGDGEVVALKVLAETSRLDPRRLSRFRREAQTASRLSHPHIVRIRESGDIEGLPTIAMDCVDGASLAKILSEGRMPLRQFVPLLEKVARAVHYAHQSGVVHRDLKPANILVDNAGEPRITDFGLAKIDHPEGGLTRGGIPLGTPAYMSPEQVEGEPREIDLRSDVYALGAILYEALTGRVPFPGTSPMDVFRQVRQGTFPPPSALNPRVPAPLQECCLRALERDKTRRHASALEFADDLKRAGAARTSHAR